MADYPSTPEDYVIASYRYLRLAMVIVVVVLAVSLVIEIVRASCWQGSISEYYYTPVHAVFVGALVTIGVCLVALKGRDSVEDLFLNLAGVLAPVVALVPTSRPGTVCSQPGSELTVTTTALVSNNIPALLVGTGLAIIVAYLIASRQKRIDDSTQPKAELKSALTRANIVGFILSAAFLIAGFAWYQANTTSFAKYAHGWAAVAMFVAIWGAVMIDAGWPEKLLNWLYKTLRENPIIDPVPNSRAARYRTGYRLISVFMVIVALVVIVTRSITWNQRTFWLEALEIAPFAVFWILQTLEGWETGPTNQAVATTMAS